MPSGVVNPLLQWGGRIHFLLAVVRLIDEVVSIVFRLLLFNLSPKHDSCLILRNM